MGNFVKIWEEYLRPLVQRPKSLQVAALCLRDTLDGVPEVLMITSRGTGRWIIPKGWPMDGKTCAEAALQEAWEEAGVRSAKAEEIPVGSFDYEKWRDNGTAEPVTALVYKLHVTDLADDFPEDHERQRKWFRPHVAAELIAEPQLRALLLTL